MLYELKCEYHKWLVSSIDSTYINLIRSCNLGYVPFTKYEAKNYKIFCKKKLFADFELDEKTGFLKAFINLSDFNDGNYSFSLWRMAKNNVGYKALRSNKIKMYVEKFVEL